MKLRLKWKKMLTIAADIVLAVYLVLAFTTFNKPKEAVPYCSIVNIIIEDEDTNGFIKTKEIKDRLKSCHLYPIEKPMAFVDSRKIEETLKMSPFVKTAECYKTVDGHVNISITQRMPIVRIKANNGEDYYLDDHDCVMPNSQYTSDLIIATGNINKWFASNYISPLSKSIMKDELWKNQIEQVNVLSDRSIELVPRVGNHVICIGRMPESKKKEDREALIDTYFKKKMNRLEKFYKYGLSEAGWNKYAYINLEFDNQIICKKRKKIN
jgi:cell division protein FtsQ